MVKVVQKDLEAVGKKRGLKLGTLTERNRYGYYYYLNLLVLVRLLLLLKTTISTNHTATGINIYCILNLQVLCSL